MVGITSGCLAHGIPWPGLCILTTNARDAIDSAFFRRFRFMVEPGAQTMIKIDTL